jgi:dephospho-CoA kinase
VRPVARRPARQAKPSGSRRPAVIGLVGGIGSGKSEVARLIVARGGVLVDADRIGHEVLREPGVKEEVRARWGEAVFGPDGEVDRGRLADEVFAESAESGRDIEALNRIVHPELLRRVRGAVAEVRQEARAPWVLVDAALLLEWGLDGVCDVVVFVDASAEERRRRVREGRGWSPGELARRERRQLPLEEKRARAGQVLPNGGSREALGCEVERLLAALRGSVGTGRSG